jgi:hypothetical protein
VQALWKPFSLTALLDLVRSGLARGESVLTKESQQPAVGALGS